MSSSFRDALGKNPEQPAGYKTPPTEQAPIPETPERQLDTVEDAQWSEDAEHQSSAPARPPARSWSDALAASAPVLDEVEDAQWSDLGVEQVPEIPAHRERGRSRSAGDVSDRKRRRIAGATIIAAVLGIALAVMVAHGAKVAQPSIHASSAGHVVRFTPTTPTTTTSPLEVGQPTAAEIAAAQHALTLAAAVILSQYKAQTLIDSDQQLHDLLISEDHYAIDVVSGRTLPFIANKRGELSVTFTHGLGFFQLTASAGKANVLVTQQVNLPPLSKFAIPSDGMFASGSAKLTAQGLAGVHNTAKQLGSSALSVKCVGYTDNQGSIQYNYRLGLARAQAVCGELYADGVAAKLTVSSGGLTRPRASNATAAGRALNRRVELDISYYGD